MKKLLTVLCVAACGIGAAAQAQLSNAGQRVQHLEAQSMKVSDELFAPQADVILQATADGAQYDTILWGPEYIVENEDCRGNYLVWWLAQNETPMGVEFFPHVSGIALNGTAEFGATYRTSNDAYYEYNRLHMGDYNVVGAVALAFRAGLSNVWDKEGRREGLGAGWPVDNEGFNVPNVKVVLKGYKRIVRQEVVQNYLDLFGQTQNSPTWEMRMPVNTEEYVHTDTLFIQYRGAQEDDSRYPRGQMIGGLFNEPIYAGLDYGLSMQGILKGDAKYDSVWNYGMYMKSGDHCVLLDPKVTWMRLDYSNPNGMNMWIQNGESWNTRDLIDEGGFMLEGCPQAEYEDNQGLFVYGFSLLKSSSDYMPALYAIVQKVSDEYLSKEKQDAYAQTISVYPMPATDKVNVVALDPIKTVEIYNMAGTLLKHITMNDNVLEFDVTSYAPGTYVARITTEKGVATKKLLVK